jgi:hypothetical protein
MGIPELHLILDLLQIFGPRFARACNWTVFWANFLAGTQLIGTLS